MSNQKTSAVELFRAGFAIFPLLPDAKDPAEVLALVRERAGLRRVRAPGRHRDAHEQPGGG